MQDGAFGTDAARPQERRRRGRPTLEGTGQRGQYSPVLRARVPYSLVDELEWLRAEMSARVGRTLTLSDVVREALLWRVADERSRAREPEPDRLIGTPGSPPGAQASPSKS